MPCRRLQSLALCLLIGALLLACDSRQRGPEQTAASNDKPPTEEPTESQTPAVEPDEAASAKEPPEKTALERYTEDLEGDGPLMVAMETTHGTIECELHHREAPVTVASFVGLARGLKAFVDSDSGEPVSGVPYYDGVIFHRVIRNFLIQSGDRRGDGQGSPGYVLPDEFSDSLRHDRPGVLSMANRGPDTGGSQFFILEAPAPHLDDRHTVFGQCDSVDVIRTISHVPTEDLGRPVDPAPRIESMRFYFGD